jgi:ATP-dependent RNA helicase SUPV3L1/SUV3
MSNRPSNAARSTGSVVAQGRVTAVLGPTNTGKTHFAIERMLAHRTGIIGLPLRLLAREVYDRVVRLKGEAAAALITGEEKIIGREARYFVATVEAMPKDRLFEFLAVDEIQLATDLERGHVFTDRLLHARGVSETLFLGSETMRPVIKRLIPEATFITRPRLSTLTHAGYRKLARLPRRSAIVAFSANEVYALAEAVRRQRGGAAVVLGALSPRTRNAQVAMFEAGEVDYLVATDAIGMGLNLGVDHVAFASLDKFDGKRHRPLTAGEVAQIAGRAGRHMRDGTFGTTAGTEQLDPDVVVRVEEHRFEPVRQLQWRSSDLDFSSVAALLRTLERMPPLPGLMRVKDADDQSTLRALGTDEELAPLVVGRARVELLWQVCQIPDFRKTMADVHVRLLGRIFRHLAQDGRLPQAWVEEQLNRLDDTQGDIDTLATRLAYIRTWTFVAYRGDWLDAPEPIQDQARSIEDRLSDALHERLTQRFVDRRSSALIRSLAGEAELLGAVDSAGDVLVEGEYVGRMSGLKFIPDPDAEGVDGKAVLAAANRALGPEVTRRTDELEAAGDEVFKLDPEGRIVWDGNVLARLVPGRDALHPRVHLLPHELLDGAQRDRVLHRLERFVATRVETVLGALTKLQSAEELPGPARGLAFRLGEALGAISRRDIASELDALPQPARAELRRLGVKFGKLTIYLPSLLKPEATQLKLTLRAVLLGQGSVAPPPAGHVAYLLDGQTPDEWLTAAGFRRCGTKAIRIDMLERLDQTLRDRQGEDAIAPTGELTGLVGCSNDEFVAVMRALGYEKLTLEDGAVRYRVRGRKGRPRPAPKPAETVPAQAAAPVEGVAVEAALPAEGEAAPTETVAAEATGDAIAAPALAAPAPAEGQRPPREGRRRGGKHKHGPKPGRPPQDAAAPQGSKPEGRRPEGGRSEGGNGRHAGPKPQHQGQPHRDNNRPRRPDPAPVKIDPDSPFAALAALREKLGR